MVDFVKASAGKVADEHKVIDEAIRDRGEGYTVFSIVHPFFFFFSNLFLKEAPSFVFLVIFSLSAFYTAHRRAS